MRELLESIELDGVPLFPPYYDDDSSDRLSHRQTTALLSLLALMVVTMQYVGEPINCWTPAHFKKPQEVYTDSHCWTHGTYHLPFDSDVPPDLTYTYDDARHPHPPPHHHQQQQYPGRLSYYQYVPLILLGQALGFYLPYCVWLRLGANSGLDLQSLVASARRCDIIDMADVQSRIMLDMTSQLDRYLSSRACLARPTSSTSHHQHSSQCSKRLVLCAKALCRRRHGNYLIRCYVMVKLLYVTNIITQLFLLDAFLGAPFHTYGVDVFRDLFQTNSDRTTQAVVPMRFPHSTMCDLKVHRLGAVHRYSVQCVLPINLFNEKIFLFVWFWLLLVGVVTLCSLMMWTVRFVYAPGRRRYIKQHLGYVQHAVTGEGEEAERQRKKRKAWQFVHRYLDQDGVFLLRLVAHNASTITVTELVVSLWHNYSQKVGLRHDKHSDVKHNL